MIAPANALHGITVVSLEQAVAAPYCSVRLADAGARVIKIERPEGDFARHYDHVAHGESAYFVWLNRGKESVCLDLKVPTELALIERMIARADIFIQNLAPGATDRLGLASTVLRTRHPSLITVDISGYGDTGPYSNMKAYDLLVQAESGLASITGSIAEPGRVGVSICDIACGMYAHAAVLQALILRSRTSVGAQIKVSLFDAIADWMTVPLLHFEYGGSAPSRVGLNHPSIAPYGVYHSKDGHAVLIAIQNEREWQSFCIRVLDRHDLAADPRFVANWNRVTNRKALDEAIRDVVAAFDKVELVGRLTAAQVAFGMLNSIADLSRHPQLRRSTVSTESGDISIVSPPAHILPGTVELGRVPALGEHTANAFAEFRPP